MMFDPSKPIVTLSDAAADRARRLIAAADGDILGLRIGIRTAGCSGLQYDVQYATEAKPFEDKVEEKGVTLFIDPSGRDVPHRLGNGLGRDEVRVALRVQQPERGRALRLR